MKNTLTREWAKIFLTLPSGNNSRGRPVIASSLFGLPLPSSLTVPKHYSLPLQGGCDSILGPHINSSLG